MGRAVHTLNHGCCPPRSMCRDTIYQEAQDVLTQQQEAGSRHGLAATGRSRPHGGHDDRHGQEVAQVAF